MNFKSWKGERAGGWWLISFSVVGAVTSLLQGWGPGTWVGVSFCLVSGMAALRSAGKRRAHEQAKQLPPQASMG
jgi:hypothetical protein